MNATNQIKGVLVGSITTAIMFTWLHGTVYDEFQQAQRERDVLLFERATLLGNMQRLSSECAVGLEHPTIVIRGE